MSEYFQADKDCPTLRRARKAYIETLLEECLPPMRLAARGIGYTITVHGSLSRDIDLVAIPWTKTAGTHDELVDALKGVLRGFVGRVYTNGGWSMKPHGRRAITILSMADAYFDLSVMPLIEEAETDEDSD